MSAQSDPNDACEDLKQTTSEAAKRGDIDTLQQAGAATLKQLHNHNLVELALWHRQPHVIAWLVEESERTGISIAGGWTLLHVASLLGRLETLKAASDKALAAKGELDETVLHAAAAGDQGEVIEYLVRERGADVRVSDRKARTALETASECGCLSAIDALVACGAQVHDSPDDTSMALMSAAMAGQVAAMEKLVGLGADASMVGSTGSVLHAAARFGRAEAIEAAVRLGADPEAVDLLDGTALHAAALCNQPGGMRRLVQLGVPLEDENWQGQTALHGAVRSPDACRRLLELGADRWAKDEEDNTAQDIAAAIGDNTRDRSQQVVQLLDTYFPITPSMAQLLLGLKGPSESPLTRFAGNSAFEPKVLTLVKCLLTGEQNPAFEQLVEERSTGSGGAVSSRAAKKQRQG